MSDPTAPIRLPPSAVDQAQAEKSTRPYRWTFDPDEDADGVVTTPRYRMWVQGEILVEPAEGERRVEADRLARVAERLGLEPCRQFLDHTVPIASLPRRYRATSIRRYTAEETAVYIAHFPGKTELEIAAGMFPEAPNPSLLVGRVRQMTRRLMSLGMARREKDPASGKWRFYPTREREVRGTVLSREAARFLAMRLGVPEAQAHPAVEELLRRILHRRELMATPDHPAWQHSLNPGVWAPGSEDAATVLENPRTGLVPSRPDWAPTDDQPF